MSQVPSSAVSHMRNNPAWPTPSDRDPPLPLESVNDAAVRVVLLWARRAGHSVADVGEVCAYLGLDLRNALKRAGK